MPRRERPIVLLGQTRSSHYLPIMKELGWGRMWTTRTPTAGEVDEPWGFDNGAFAAWTRGESFPTDEFEKRLHAAMRAGTPLLAVTPDIVGGGERSLEFSLAWRERLPDWPWYLAVQDGMRERDVFDAMHAFSGLFLGGTTPFKRTAQRWADLARAQGKPFHYGRASLPRRVDHAIRVGADSLDTSFPLWTRPRFDSFVRHWQHGSPQMDLSRTIAVAGPEGEWY